HRVDPTLDVNDVGVVEHADDLTDRVGLTDVGEELVAQPRALRRPFDDARDIHEGHGRRDGLLRTEDLRQLVEAWVRQRHHPDVGFDRGERIVRRQHAVTGQSVEQGGLAYVGQTDDAEGQTHDSPVYGSLSEEGPTAVTILAISSTLAAETRPAALRHHPSLLTTPPPAQPSPPSSSSSSRSRSSRSYRSSRSSRSSSSSSRPYRSFCSSDVVRSCWSPGSF